MTRTTKFTIATAVLTAMVCLPAIGLAEELAKQDQSNWLALAADKPADADKAKSAPEKAPPAAPDAWEKPGVLKAFSFGLDYTMLTDYVWRGINMSEYRGEGREKLNHQLTVSFEVDPSKLGTANIGRFGGSIWFEWFAGQEQLTGWSGNNLQEVDYTVYWAYDIEPCGLGVELGWIGYHFPRFRDSGSTVSADSAYTHEAYIKLSYDDSKIFDKPMLNPYVAYYQDIDDVRGGILAFGVSHDFVLKDMGLAEACICKDLTLTPSFAMVIDHRYYDKAGVGGDGGTGTRLGYLEYSLAVAYDLSSAFSIPAQYGALNLTGFITFDQSLHDSANAVQDEFYGGVKLSWGW